VSSAAAAALLMDHVVALCYVIPPFLAASATSGDIDLSSHHKAK
jgi:hypothetical protein